MAAKESQQYYLRSGGQETIQVPVQLQLSDDTKFLTDLLSKTGKCPIQNHLLVK